MKICKKCGEEFPLTSEYYRKRNAKKGFSYDNICKDCTSKQKKRYYQKNKEHIIKKTKIWNLNNKERVKENQRKYVKNNRETINAHQREWGNRKENREHIRNYHREYSKKWRKGNEEHIKEYMENNKKIRTEKRKVYLKNHRELSRRATQRRNALKRKLPATLTVSEWEFIKESFGFTCCYCGKKLPLVQEHYVAVANLGGYELGNIVPACQSCNSSKGAKLINDWYPTHKSYSPERESKILSFIEKTKEMNLINNLKVA